MGQVGRYACDLCSEDVRTCQGELSPLPSFLPSLVLRDALLRTGVYQQAGFTDGTGEFLRVECVASELASSGTGKLDLRVTRTIKYYDCDGVTHHCYCSRSVAPRLCSATHGVVLEVCIRT